MYKTKDVLEAQDRFLIQYLGEYSDDRRHTLLFDGVLKTGIHTIRRPVNHNQAKQTLSKSLSAPKCFIMICYILKSNLRSQFCRRKEEIVSFSLKNLV